MGHADVATTMRYLHYVPRPEDARLIAAAFGLDESGGELGVGQVDQARDLA